MAFVYKPDKHSAVDESRGVTIGRSLSFYDEAREIPFSYREGDIQFDFFVIFASERRKVRVGDGLVETDEEVGAVIVADTVRRGLCDALKAQSVEAALYERVTETIREGMFCLGTRGGKRLAEVPDFHVRLVT